MERIVEKVDGFFQSKKITWLDKCVYDEKEMQYRTAKEEDFDCKKFLRIAVKSAKGNFYHKQLLVTSKLFLVFDGKLKALEKDLSDAWKIFQEKFDKEEKTDSNENQPKPKMKKFSKYLEEERYDVK